MCFAVVFQDNFDTLNTTLWKAVIGGGNSQTRNASGTAENVYVQDGNLVIASKREHAVDPKTGKVYSFTSGGVDTQGQASFSHGRVCFVAKLPGGGGFGRGIWPAHWMMPDDTSCWPDHGEIDVMEMINGDGTHHATYHWNRMYPGTPCQGQTGNTDIGLSAPDTTFDSEWHEYAVEYDGSTHITFYLDGKIVNKITPGLKDPKYHAGAQIHDVPYYLIINTAVRGLRADGKPVLVSD